MQLLAFGLISDELLLIFPIQIKIFHVILVAFFQNHPAVVPAGRNDLVPVIVLGNHIFQPFNRIVSQQKQSRIKAVPSDLPEEIRYFQLYDAVRRTLTERFPEMDEALLDKLTSDFCEEN